MNWIAHPGLRASQLKRAIGNAAGDMYNNHSLIISAGMSYYFLFALFPALIFAAAVLAYLPIPNLFNHILNSIAQVVPADSMSLIRQVISGVIKQRRGGILSASVIGILWAASGGFSAIIEGLNVAYNAREYRPYWRVRLIAFGLSFLIGTLMMIALGLILFGPHFGQWLANNLDAAPVYAALWPWIRWGISVAFVLLAVELLYYIGPNVKQHFKSTMLGSVFAVAGWIGVSNLLGLYFRHFPNYNAMYGSLGALLALMLWFYLSGIALLFGAEVNAEFRKSCGEPPLGIRYRPRNLLQKEISQANEPQQSKAA